MNGLHVELKVCEGCGALWLRAKVANGVYCRRCTATLAEFPAPRGRRTRSPKRTMTSSPVMSPNRESAVVLAGGAR
jgi:hypothetical protein